MTERYTVPKFAVAATAVFLGGASIAGCGSNSGENKSAGASSATVAPGNSASAAEIRPYPWPYCDNAPEHRAPAVGSSKDGLEVLIDSNCTDPSDPYTGVYDSLGDPSQATGIPRGRIRNGAQVTVLCRRPDGQEVYNDQHVGSTDWDLVRPAVDQDILLPNGNDSQTTGNEMFLVPNTHLAFYNDTAIGACAMK